MYRHRSPPKLCEFDAAGLKSLQMMSNGPLVFQKRKVVIDFKVLPGRKGCLPSIRLYKVLKFQTLCFLVGLKVSDCNHCLYLPPLGQLSCLKYLTIEKMNGVQRVGLEFYGISHSSIKSFQSLEILIFGEMLGWQEWIFTDVEGGEFPSLKELYIKKCPKLKWSLPKYLPPCIRKVEVSACSSLVIPKLPNRDYRWLGHNPSILEVVEDYEAVDSNMVHLKNDFEIAFQSSYSDVDSSDASDIDDNDPVTLLEWDELEFKRMKVSYFPRLLELPSQLHILTIENCAALRSLPEEVTCDKNCLRHLYIYNCCNFESFHGGHLPSALETLGIRNCRKLELLSPKRKMSKNSHLTYLYIESSCDSLSCLPLDLFPKLESLVISDCANFSSILIKKDHMLLHKLHILDCPKLLSFPKGGLCTPNLFTILLSNCKNLKALPNQLYKLRELLFLQINGCPELESIPKGGFPCHLHCLRIKSCDKLTPQAEWGMFKLANLRYFEIEGGCKRLKSFPDEYLLPSCVCEIRISNLQDLEYLDYEGFKHLKSLEILTISSCKWLRSWPSDRLPSSLNSLYINECPLLKSTLKYDVKTMKMCFDLDHIRHLEIDGEVI